MVLRTTSPEHTEQLGRRLAALLAAGDTVALTGPLGAGKTCLVRGLARGLGVTGPVSSPSFVLMKHYPGSPGLCHVDAYRLSGPAEFADLGLADWQATSIVAVEWADRVAAELPPDRLDIALSYGAEEGERVLSLTATTRRLAAALRSLASPPLAGERPPRSGG